MSVCCVQGESGAMGSGKILIIEDNPLNLELATDLLEAGGYTVLHARTAEKGIRLARDEAPDLILMDISLPGIDGISATGLLKQDAATQDIPVVALTANAMKGDAEKALAAGCQGYITKPIDTRAFAVAVSRFMPSRGGA